MAVKMTLRRKPREVRLGRAFKKAVVGYRALQAEAERKRAARMPTITIERVEAERAAIAAPAAPPAAVTPTGVPITPPPAVYLPRRPPEVDLTAINVTYPLVPRAPPPGTRPFAAANIRWSAPDTALIYYLLEPELGPAEKDLLARIKTSLIEKLDIDFAMLRRVEAKEYLRERFDEMVALMAAELPPERRAALLYFVERDFIGLDKIEPLMEDPDIEDVSVDGVGIPAYVYHRNPLFGSIRTNVVFETPDELDTFVHKIAQRCGKSISVAAPLLGAALPDGSRVQATLATDIARRGSNFCVRDAFVQMADGSITDIKRLFEHHKGRSGFKKENENEIVEPSGIEVVGVDPLTMEQKPAKVKQIIKLAPPKRLVEIKFVEAEDDSSKIAVTENHQFHVLTRDGIRLVDAKELKKNMFVPVPTRVLITPKDVDGWRRIVWDALEKYPSRLYVVLKGQLEALINHSSNKDVRRRKTTSIPLDEFKRLASLSGMNISQLPTITVLARVGRGGRCSKLTIPLHLTADMAYFIGWVIGDGHVSKGGVNIAIYNDETVRNILELVRNLFGKNCNAHYGGARIYINSQLLSWLLCNVGIPRGKKARIVDVPQIIEMSPDEISAAFVRGLLESDGSSSPPGFSTFSPKLAKKIGFLLARFGIFSYTRKDGPQWKVFVPAAYYSALHEQIAPYNAQLAALAARHRKDKKSRQLPSDIVLGLLDEATKKLNINHGDLFNIANLSDIKRSGRITFDKTEQLADFVISQMTTDGGMPNQLQLLYGLIGGGLEFKRIREVRIKANKAPVFDLVCDPVNFYIGGISSPLFLHDTIRKFTELPLTPTHMLRFKTIDSKIGAYLWLAIEYGRSLLISGGVATGKTSLLNALSLFIKPELKIVSIEDTPELKLPQPNWIAQVARQPIAEVEGRRIGEVDLFDLLRESLRQRPDYLIVGEVRGKEAFVLFQQIATGHASMSTIHADTMERLIDRLTTPPISLPGALLEALDIIVFLVRIKYGPAYVRRVANVFEITGFDRTANVPVTNEVYRWNPAIDRYDAVNPSVVFKKIAAQYGIPEATLLRELGQRVKVLDWLAETNMTDYRDIARVIKLYYTRPEEVLAAI